MFSVILFCGLSVLAAEGLYLQDSKYMDSEDFLNWYVNNKGPQPRANNLDSLRDTYEYSDDDYLDWEDILAAEQQPTIGRQDSTFKQPDWVEIFPSQDLTNGQQTIEVSPQIIEVRPQTIEVSPQSTKVTSPPTPPSPTTTATPQTSKVSQQTTTVLPQDLTIAQEDAEIGQPDIYEDMLNIYDFIDVKDPFHQKITDISSEAVQNPSNSYENLDPEDLLSYLKRMIEINWEKVNSYEDVKERDSPENTF